MPTTLPKNDICPNCGYEVKQSNFCPECGQENIEYRVSLKTLIRYYISKYLRLDTKLIKTLKMLVLKPWHLTELYLQGKRKEYTSPIGLYFILSLLFVLGLRIQYLRSQGVKLAGTTVKIKVNESNAGKNELAEPQKQKIFLQFIKQLPNAMLISVPIVALILTILYYRSKKYMFIDHLILMIHYYAFVYLLTLPFSFIPYLNDLTLIPIIASILYLWVFMKQFYQESFLKTTYKYLVFNILSQIVIMILSLGLVLLIVIKESFMSKVNF
ncbi:MAG: DUF3667 domain-containing protein [Bacteroidia bacterium]|nr:DUF3667 domain-containing protein [Bacteroidia bacterium]MDW8345558.1 DUF3667 domain-containing protein [Bacteroidia bacterium]